MDENITLLEKLDLLKIDDYEFEKALDGGSALSGLYSNGEKKVVFKFLISPRNIIELERFKLEFSVLDKNKMNWFEGIEIITPRPSMFFGPEESYPIPKICHSLVSTYNNQVNYFGYEYEEGVLLADLDTSNYQVSEKTQLLYRIASGLNYFNQLGYSHRDLHPENILLLDNPVMARFEHQQNNPKIKILDMGNCQKIITSWGHIDHIQRDLNEDIVFQDNNKRLLSSFTSMPPDFLEKGDKTENYDSWSFGVFAYSLLFDEMPFTVETIHDVTLLRETRHFSNDYQSNLNSIGIGYKLILKHLLSPRGEDRPTIDAIVRLFSWLVFRADEFTDTAFIKRVIHNSGEDPDFDFVRDYY